MMRTTIIKIGPTLLLLISMGLFGCLKDNQKKPKAKEEPVQGDTNSPDDIGSGNPPDTNDDFVDGGTTGGDTEEDPLQALLESCGGKEFADAEESTVIYDKVIKSLPNDVLGSLIQVSIDVDIKVTKVQAIQDAVVNIDAGGGVIENVLDIFAEKNTGKTIATNVPFSEFSSLSDHSQWEGVLCTFVPATRLVNERGSKTTVRFEPPMPLTLSPRAIASRYSDEIGDRKVFENMKVIIEQTDNSDLEGKTEVTGTVTVEKIDPVLVYEVGDQEKRLTADVAYRMTFDFETPTVTSAMGLSPAMTYYVSHEKKEVMANILDTKAFLTGSFTFIH